MGPEGAFVRLGGSTQWSKPLLLPLLQVTSQADFVALVCINTGRQRMIAVHILALEQFVLWQAEDWKSAGKVDMGESAPCVRNGGVLP